MGRAGRRERPELPRKGGAGRGELEAMMENLTKAGGRNKGISRTIKETVRPVGVCWSLRGPRCRRDTNGQLQEGLEQPLQA